MSIRARSAGQPGYDPGDAEVDMSATTLLVACAILLGPATANGHSTAQGPDPVSGVWVDQKDPAAVLNLTLDTNGGVTGTVGIPQGPAPIENGTYSAKTGALK